MTDPEVTPFGDRALLVDVGSTAAAHRVAQAIEAELATAAGDRSVTGVVVGFGSVVVLLDHPEGPDGPARARIHTLIQTTSAEPSRTEGRDRSPVTDRRRVVEIPVVFDGPDLGEVAAEIGVEPSQVEDLLVGAELEVAFVGFAPGFPYLTGLPPALASLRRRPSPRPSVPAGSVALAGGFASVYPRSTPGGWLLVGTTTVTLFDPTRPPYALVRAGDAVRFTRAAATPGEYPVPSPPEGGRPRMEPQGRRWVEVIDPGLLTMVQDRGRRGVAGIGVPEAGAADPQALLLANRLVGNDDGAAAIEITAVGPSLRFAVDAHLAVVGIGAGAVDVALDGRPCPDGSVVPVGSGQLLGVGPVRAGLRAYLAVAGGFETPTVMGSRSSDLLSGLGTGPLRAGDRLGLGEPTRPHGVLLDPGRQDGGRGPRTVRVIAGPRRGGGDAWSRLLATRWTVDVASNRIGVRLVAEDGPGPTGTASEGGASTGWASTGWASTGMVTGAIQLPPDGQPIILLPDHATVGGYPVVGCVITADLPVAGQLAPGDRVRFAEVDLEEAHRAWHHRARLLDGRVRGWFPTAAGT